jgi:hypothetical protein
LQLGSKRAIKSVQLTSIAEPGMNRFVGNISTSARFCIVLPISKGSVALNEFNRQNPDNRAR